MQSRRTQSRGNKTTINKTDPTKLSFSLDVTPDLGALEYEELLSAGRRASIARTRINRRVSLVFMSTRAIGDPHFQHLTNNDAS